MNDRAIGKARLLRQPDLAGSAGRVALRATGRNGAFRWRSACSLSSGRLKPLSPAKPQHSTSSHRDDVAAAARRRCAASLSTVPILRTLHTGWTATGSRIGTIATRGRTRSWMNSMLSCTARRPASSASSDRRTDWCRTRSASVRRRWRRARRLELRRLAVGRLAEALALERLAAAQLGERLRVDDVEAGFAEQTLRHRRQRFGRRRRAARPWCARRSSGNRRSAPRSSTAAARAARK